MFFIPEYLDPERNAGPGDRPAFFAFFSVPGMLTGNAISVLIIDQSVHKLADGRRKFDKPGKMCYKTYRPHECAGRGRASMPRRRAAPCHVELESPGAGQPGYRRHGGRLETDHGGSARLRPADRIRYKRTQPKRNGQGRMMFPVEGGIALFEKTKR